MPKLPEENKGRDFELLDKDGFDRGAMSQSKPVIIKHHLHLPFRQIVGLLVVIVLLGGIYVVTKTYFPDLLKKKVPPQAETKAFEYPLNVNDVTFPNEIVKEKFLANFKSASTEKDIDKRFEYLADNYSLIQGFYAASGSYDYRVQLEKYRDYLNKNYPKQYEGSKGNFEIVCVDKLCGEMKYPPEITKLIGDVTNNSKIDPLVKSSILRNFDGASFSQDKSVQVNFYLSSLSMLFSETQRTNDPDVKSNYFSLLGFFEHTYPEIVVPAQIKMEVGEK